jgi:hypothetical protein
MSQLVKTERQANFKDFKRFGASKGFVEPKNVVFNSFVLKAHECQKRPNLHTNSSNKLLLYHLPIYGQWATFIFQMVTYNFFSDCNGIKKITL